MNSKFENYINISSKLIETAKERTKAQEALYGHNTGHFTLSVEKENAFTGVIGELLVVDFFNTSFIKRNVDWRCALGDYGSEADINFYKNGTVSRKMHVKTGLWKAWPGRDYHFGIHSDQSIESSGLPLVLVSILKNPKGAPEQAKIEGFITSKFLQSCKIIKKGQRFPSTQVVSRTDNLLTRFEDYRHIDELLESF